MPRTLKSIELQQIADRAKAEAVITANRRLKDRLYTLARAADQVNAVLQDTSMAAKNGAQDNTDDVFLLLQVNR